MRQPPYRYLFIMIISKLALLAILLSGKGIILPPIFIALYTHAKNNVAATANIHIILLTAAAA